jgi:hypothetical protein
MRQVLAYAVAALLGTTAFVHGRPNLVPPGWQPAEVEPGETGRRFVSADGTSWMTAKQSAARRDRLASDMEAIAQKPGERITYQRRGASWIAVSGYRGDQIFYRKANLACGGTRWNTIEFRYPAAAKRQMDDAVTRIAHDMTRYYVQCPSASATP